MHENSPKIYLKGLNGIRAIAAVAVMITHLNSSFPLTKYNLENIGSFAVTFFFSLSGFLITYLLLIEKAKTGGVSLKKFYIRRILRIWPLYYVYLLIVFIFATVIFHIYELDINFLYLIFFAVNFSMSLKVAILPYASHYWSLAVEEQFYIFWPLLIKHTAKPISTIFFFLISYILLKLSVKFFFPNQIALLTILNKTKFDIMAIGGLAACFLYEKKAIFLTIVSHKITQLITVVCVLLAFFNKTSMFFSIFEHDVIGAVISVIIVNQCVNQNPIFSLENKVFNFLGKISFGIYVYHMFFIMIVEKSSIFENHILLVAYSIVPVMTVLTAYLSYKYYEMPFLDIKEKFSVVHSTNNINT